MIMSRQEASGQRRMQWKKTVALPANLLTLNPAQICLYFLYSGAQLAENMT
jgi:hypothetical protein